MLLWHNEVHAARVRQLLELFHFLVVSVRFHPLGEDLVLDILVVGLALQVLRHGLWECFIVLQDGQSLFDKGHLDHLLGEQNANLPFLLLCDVLLL